MKKYCLLAIVICALSSCTTHRFFTTHRFAEYGDCAGVYVSEGVEVSDDYVPIGTLTVTERSGVFERKDMRENDVEIYPAHGESSWWRCATTKSVLTYASSLVRLFGGNGLLNLRLDIRYDDSGLKVTEVTATGMVVRID